MLALGAVLLVVAADPPSMSRADALKHGREHADLLLRTGFVSRADVQRRVTEYLRDMVDEDAALKADIEQVIAAASAALAAEQKGWPAVTDNDRLDRSFAALERQGVLARQNYSDCQTCGTSEIVGELERRPKAHGYVFFHEQDSEGAVSGSGVYLAFGSLKGTEASLAVGREIVAALEKAGLKVQWDRSLEHRIFVELKWQRRPAPSKRLAPP